MNNWAFISDCQINHNACSELIAFLCYAICFLVLHEVVEGYSGRDVPFSSGLNPRKRLHSAEEVKCGSRPNPEGAGSVSVTEISQSEKKDDEDTLCQRCQIIASELNRQAFTLADPGSLKVGTSLRKHPPKPLTFILTPLIVTGLHSYCLSAYSLLHSPFCN